MIRILTVETVLNSTLLFWMNEMTFTVLMRLKTHKKKFAKMFNFCLNDYQVFLYNFQMFSKEPLTLVFTIPIFEPLPTQYYVKAISDRWLGCESMYAISFQHLILPERHPPHTGYCFIIILLIAKKKIQNKIGQCS